MLAACKDEPADIDISRSNWILHCADYPDYYLCQIISDTRHYNTYAKALKINVDSNSLMVYELGTCPPDSSSIGFFWREVITDQVLFIESDYAGMYSTAMDTTILFRFSLTGSTIRLYMLDTSETNALFPPPFDLLMKYIEEIPENSSITQAC